MTASSAIQASAPPAMAKNPGSPTTRLNAATADSIPWATHSASATSGEQSTAALAADLALAIDPVRFALAAGIAPDPWQATLLRSAAPRVLLNCSRQSGKSTTVGLIATHTALYEPDSLVLLLSPGERQSKELFKKVMAAYRASGRPVAASSETTQWLELENGSRIVALPGDEKNVRGFSSVRVLIIDEAARVDGDLYAAVRPMLAVSGGRLLALSTPFGRRGWWSDSWHAEGGWERYLVPATECPRITPEFLAEERERLGEWWFQQEYMCQFLDAETQAFRSEDIDRAFKENVETWNLLTAA